VSTFADLKTIFEGLGYVGDATAETQLRTAYLQVLSERRWRFLTKTGTVTTTPSTREVDLSTITDLAMVDAVTIDLPTVVVERAPLQYVTPQEERRVYAADPTASEPIYWTEYEDGTLRLWPVPDRAYTLSVDYVVDVGTAITDSTELLIPAAYLDVVAWAAAVPIATRQRDYSGAQLAAGQYERRLARMSRAHGMRQRSNSSQVKNDTAFWDSARR
jgi:hypothetical protein